jgi:hypothetical protein
MITSFIMRDMLRSGQGSCTLAAMNVMVPIPDDLAARFGSEAELGRRVVEALALEEYRAGRLTRPELRQALGFATRGELDGFLNDRGVVEEITVEEFDRQMQDLDRIGL